MTKVSVIKKIKDLLDEAINRKASDLHFEVYENHFRVRFRIDGILQEFSKLPIIQKDEFIARLKILSELNTAEKRRPQDGKFKHKFSGRDIDIRLSILPTFYGEKAVLRILDRHNVQLSIDELGMSSLESKIFQQHINNPYGMILVTGPTGSGKTTTLYSALNLINSDEVNITTIEDPVEYNLHGINQSQVKPDIDYKFSTALRSILRQDPDVIMIGEIRDRETAEIAIHSALTGHLVLSTLHTNDATSAITRLVNMGIEKYMIASSLKLVIAQRLVRKICDKCKIFYTPDQELLKQLGLNPQNEYYHGKGCEACNNTGYRGRIGVFEILQITPEICNMILDEKSETFIKEQIETQDMNKNL
ncbi:MAG: GspE/PulE family protein [Candidatus Cloacimonetes bacterium]|nr:GspE/PulE family protein [Candidatus Cloacimonadota bacterium]